MNYHYVAYVGFAEEGYEPFDVNSDLDKLIPKYYGVPDERKPFLLKIARDCRERICQVVYDNLVEYRDNDSPLAPSTVYIQYADDVNGRHQSSVQLERLQSFADLVLNHDPFQKFYLTTTGEYPVLSFSVFGNLGSYSQYLATTSFLFYIFNNISILNWCLEYAKERKVTLSKLCLALSKQFIESADWGNAANENVALSFYAYFIGVSDSPVTSNFRLNGPVHFAYGNISMTTMRKYVRKIVLPSMISHKKTLKPGDSLTKILPIWAKLNTDFGIALRSLIISESMEE